MDKIGRDFKAGCESNCGNAEPKEFAPEEENNRADDKAEEKREVHRRGKQTFNVQGSTLNV